MPQILLFPDPRPLVDKLGREFFRSLPQTPGVYLMRDAGDAVLYVGKARNLHNRLGSYRVANPDRMPPRHLRMLRAVARIELHECLDEPSALTRESELLRALKPKFNRAGTWPPTPRFLVWRQLEETLELAVTEKCENGWELFGPLGSSALSLRNALVRLLWCAAHPELEPSRMPCGWVHGRFESVTLIGDITGAGAIAESIPKLFPHRPDAFIESLRATVAKDLHPCDKAVVEADLEFLDDFFSRNANKTVPTRRSVPNEIPVPEVTLPTCHSP